MKQQQQRQQLPAWLEKELEKRELDEVFPGKCKSNSRRDETRLGKINKMFEKRNKIREREMCLAKVELLDWQRSGRRKSRVGKDRKLWEYSDSECD